jgi:hypothetical protein
MENEKPSITINTIVSEVFKWIGFVWTGMSIFIAVQYHMNASEQITRREFYAEMYDISLGWAIVAVPAFVASYFGKK